MKPFNRKLLAGFCALALAVVVTAWLYQRHSDRTRFATAANQSDLLLTQEHQISEAVYMHAIQNSEGHPSSSLFFLSKGEDGDPDTEVVNRLRSRAYRVKPVSQSRDEHAVIKDKDTGEPGVILKVGKMTPVDSTRVDVELSAYSGWGDVKGYVYDLVRGENGWVVRDREFVFES